MKNVRVIEYYFTCRGKIIYTVI